MIVEKHTILHLADAFGNPNIPSEINLGDHNAPMLLARLESGMARLGPHRRDAVLRNLHLNVPAPEAHGHGLVLLPGGAVALRCGLEGVMVCDPQTATALSAGPARRLRAAVAATPGVVTLSHDENGLQARHGLPEAARFQACSIIPEASTLAASPALRGWTGRALVQWRPSGAVAWRMTEAPSILSLAASVAGTAVENGAQALPVSRWDANDRPSRLERIAPGLYERVNDLLTGEVSDALRWALAERAVSGDNNQAERLIEALRVLPSLFSSDPFNDTGASLLEFWPRASEALSGAADLALVGIEAGANGVDGLAALRRVLDGEGLFFSEAGEGAAFFALGGRQARHLAAHIQPGERCGALIALPATPHELLAFAEKLARRINGRVVVSAPCWNFYYRTDAQTGAEAGNAIWFGMGAGLDELEWL